MRGNRLPCPLLPVAIVFMLGLSHPIAADESIGARNRIFDLRLSPGIGYFMYPQSVNGGYFIDGKQYNLVWSGMQLHIAGEVQFFIPRLEQLSLGFGGAFLFAPNPTAMDYGQATEVLLDQSALGGYFGFSASYRTSKKLRFSLLAGYGGTGISSDYGFGGTGIVLSPAVDFLFPSKGVIGGFGIRALVGFLNSPGTASMRGESGTIVSLIFETSGDWIPRF
jgi:hypothetical protein